MRQCPECGFTRAWPLSDGRWKCRRCANRYRLKPFRSAWESIRLPEAVKLRLLDYFLLGVPSYRLRFHGLASAPSRERFYRLVRAAMAHEEQLREPLDGLVELDETTFGGHRPGKRGWGAAGKIIVFGILKRNGVVRLCPVARRTKQNVIREIRLHTKPGSLYYTDEWQAYASLSVRGEHVVVKKERGKPKGKDTINGIEGFWSYAKNWLYMYRGFSHRLAHLYLGEVSYRFNHRDEALFPLVNGLLRRLGMEEFRPLLVQTA